MKRSPQLCTLHPARFCHMLVITIWRPLQAGCVVARIDPSTPVNVSCTSIDGSVPSPHGVHTHLIDILSRVQQSARAWRQELDALVELKSSFQWSLLNKVAAALYALAYHSEAAASIHAWRRTTPAGALLQELLFSIQKLEKGPRPPDSAAHLDVPSRACGTWACSA